MEEWQCEGIRQNKVKLLRLTHCNEILLAILVANDILTFEEKDLIASKATQALKADKLYEILPSRVGAYDVLLRASRETNQSGLQMILEDAQLNHNLSVALEQCNKSEFNNQSLNPFFISANLSFESLRRAIANFIDIEIFKLVFKVKEEMKPWLLRGPINETLLHVSVAYGYISVIELLISLGVDVNSLDGFGRTSYHYIGKFSTNVIATTKIFISHKINLNQVDKEDMTIATKVASYGTINQLHYHHWADYMIKNKYRYVFTKKSKRGGTSIHRLMEHLDLENSTIEIILKAGNININQPDIQGRTILHCALMFGRSLKLVKNLLDLGADYKYKSNTKEGALHFAVKGGNKDVIVFLISLKLDMNELDESRETPLHKVRYTRSRDYLGMTAFLLNNGANVLAKNQNENTVAHLFALAAHISSEDFQIWAEGVISSGQGHIFAIRGQCGRTPLQDAMQRLDMDLTTFKLILESSQVDIDLQDDDGDTLLLLALHFGRSLKTIKNLISLGANLLIKNKIGSGVLHDAVVGGKQEVIQHLISRGLDVNDKNSNANTPLHSIRLAIPKRYDELTKLLLKNGADLYSKNKHGNTLAHLMACWKGVSCDDFKIWVIAMIENGYARLFNIRGFNGKTPLHYSMKKRDLDLETIKLIIESTKLDINQPDEQGNTILHLALEFGRSLDTIKNLLYMGADWKKKGRQGGSILHCAVEGSNEEAFLHFKSLGADVNTTDEIGQTPLHDLRWTRSKYYLGMTRFLLENGANLNAKDKNGKTLDQLMSSNENISADEYAVWKEGMIKMGHGAFFQQESS